MEQPLVDLIRNVSQALDRNGVQYAITGSVASSVHGEPVASADVDYIVEMNADQARSVCRSLQRDYYASEEGFLEAVQRCGMTNVVDAGSGLSADISVSSMTDYLRLVFTRKVAHRLEPDEFTVWLVSPEDIVLMKLLWRKDSRSAKQWQGALGVLRVQGGSLDWEYLREQAKSLGIKDDLDALRDEAGI